MQADIVSAMLEITIKVMDRGDSLQDLHQEITAFLEAADSKVGSAGVEGVEQLACLMSRAAWSAMPNPSRQFVIEKLPPLGRNDRCAIGLGCKHKQCCGDLPTFPPLDAQLCWATLCELLPASRLPEMLASKRLPDGLLSIVAHRLAATEPERVRALLEPRFAGVLDPKDKHLGELLLALCDAYDALDKPKLKFTLLTRVANEAIGQTRADALQRLATITADKGDYKQAWALFADAQRTVPDDPSLSHLEIVMLISEGRQEEARQRARFWIAKFQRNGHDEQMEPMLDWLRQIAQGEAPEDAMAKLTTPELGVWSQRFLNVVKAGLARSADGSHLRLVPTGAAGNIDDAAKPKPDPAAFERSLVDRLVKMGVPKNEAREQASAMTAELKTKAAVALDAPEPDEDDPPDEISGPEYVLETSAAMAAIETQWHRAWPLGKPFSVHPLPQEIRDVWSVPQVEFWVAFLENNPLAFNSLDILDDILIAIELMPDDVSGWSGKAARQKVFQRAIELFMPVCIGDVVMPWLYEQNRPALRLLVGNVYDHLDRRDHKVLPLMQQVLQLNPNDNHGLRDLVVNELLAQGDNAGALALIEKYADDGMPALSYGRVLALYRQGSLLEAERALESAVNSRPKVLAWLLPARKAKPKEKSEYGILIGGDEEAWRYREAMRDIWAGTPGLLAWLKKHVA
jgi:hypothetical protein